MWIASSPGENHNIDKFEFPLREDSFRQISAFLANYRSFLKIIPTSFSIIPNYLPLKEDVGFHFNKLTSP